MADQVEKVQVGESLTEERMFIRSSALPADAVPITVLIAPWGEVESSNGKFIVDADSARLVIEAFGKQGTDLPIDYEHQSLGGAYSSPTGQAPAAGWIRALRAVPPTEDDDADTGLFAEVEWTEAAQVKLSAKEYRYLSPVVIVRKKDRRVVALHSAALTNKPAIVGMKPIVNRELIELPVEGERQVESSRDSDGQTDSTVSVSIEAIEVLRMRLGLDADSDADNVLQAAGSRLSALMDEVRARDACERVGLAMGKGKLAPAQREWAMSLAMKDPVAFDEWIASAPTVVMMGRTEAPSTINTLTGCDRTAVIASARAAFNAHPELALLTTESAWINNALREAGLVSTAEEDDQGSK